MRLVLLSICFILLLLSQTLVIAQEFESDPEVKDIRSRILDVFYEIENIALPVSDEISNDTEIQFQILMELWNPYNTELVSYGSSSCRWSASIEVNFDSSFEIENQGEICTADWGPRRYPSGLSNASSFPSILILNETLENIPDGNIIISGQGGTFFNKSDVSYGANVTIINGDISIDHEPIPDNWGMILFTKRPNLKIGLSGLSVFSAIIITGIILRRKSR